MDNFTPDLCAESDASDLRQVRRRERPRGFTLAKGLACARSYTWIHPTVPLRLLLEWDSHVLRYEDFWLLTRAEQAILSDLEDFAHARYPRLTQIESFIKNRPFVNARSFGGLQIYPDFQVLPWLASIRVRKCAVYKGEGNCIGCEGCGLGPRTLISRLRSVNTDQDLQRRHLLLRCLALCQKCIGDWWQHYIKPREDVRRSERWKRKRELILAYQVYSRTVHEYLLERSLFTLNLLLIFRRSTDLDLIDLNYLKTRAVKRNFRRDALVIQHASIRGDVKKRWEERMWLRDDTSFDSLDDLWKEIAGGYYHYSVPRLARPQLRAQRMWLRNVTSFDSLDVLCNDVACGSYKYSVPPSGRPSRRARSTSVEDIRQTTRISRRRYSFDDTTSWRPDFAPKELPSYTRNRNREYLNPSGRTYQSLSPLDSDENYLHRNKNFIVIGWCPRDRMEPIETCMWYTDDGLFLSELRHQIAQIRGWRHIFSLKSVQAFGMYTCDLGVYTHHHYRTKPQDDVILAQFFADCYRGALPWNQPDPLTSEEWSEWCQENLNNHTAHDHPLFPFQRQRSLRLIVRWSRNRLIIAATVPILLSLSIGFYYMYARDDAQTAWTIGSYLITAGAFIVALLAVLTSLQDGTTDVAKLYGRIPDEDSEV